MKERIRHTLGSARTHWTMVPAGYVRAKVPSAPLWRKTTTTWR